MTLNRTHDPRAASWVASAQAAGGDFPIQNLPFGVFRRAGGAKSAPTACGQSAQRAARESARARRTFAHRAVGREAAAQSFSRISRRFC